MEAYFSNHLVFLLVQYQVHILGVGLAVHEKLVHPEMRPLHKKLVDQFHMMRTGLHHVSMDSYEFGFHVSFLNVSLTEFVLQKCIPPKLFHNLFCCHHKLESILYKSLNGKTIISDFHNN